MTGHLSSGIVAKDAAVTEPFAKECKCFPVDIEDDSDDEDEDSDADVSSGKHPRIKSAVPCLHLVGTAFCVS